MILRPALSTALFLLCAGCAGRAPAGGMPQGNEAGPEPPWGGGRLFADGEADYVVGRARISTQGERCPDAKALIAEASEDARRWLGERPEPHGPVEGAQLHSGWFDGLRTFYVVLRSARTPDSVKPADRPAGPPAGGVGAAALPGVVRDGIRVALTRSGACADPYRRTELPCCGPVSTFCFDGTRFDRKAPDGTCTCGGGPPCLHDFACMPRETGVACVCDGPDCPCEILSCKPGQVCDTGRCY